MEIVIKAASPFQCPTLIETEQTMFNIQKTHFQSDIFAEENLIMSVVTPFVSKKKLYNSKINDCYLCKMLFKFQEMLETYIGNTL